MRGLHVRTAQFWCSGVRYDGGGCRSGSGPAVDGLHAGTVSVSNTMIVLISTLRCANTGAQTSAPLLPHLLFPSRTTYPPVYNLSRATVIQTCQKPGASLDYIRDYGIVSYDWSNNAAVWHADHPNDCDQKMVDQAAISKAHAPETHIWICTKFH